MNLRDSIKQLQRELGVEVDGTAGPVTISNALSVIRSLRREEPESTDELPKDAQEILFDERTEKVLATLDAKAAPLFRQFLARAQATAATLGCDYRLIGGTRTFAEQDALYAQGRDGNKGPIVTRARGGYSNHNFGIAVDAGVFLGGGYMDEKNPALAAKVHRACSMHAGECGLEWGGSWKSIVDMPHFQVATGKTTAQLREIFKAKGSVL